MTLPNSDCHRCCNSASSICAFSPISPIPSISPKTSFTSPTSPTSTSTLSIFSLSDTVPIYTRLNSIWNQMPSTASLNERSPFGEEIIPVFDQLNTFIRIQTPYWKRIKRPFEDRNVTQQKSTISFLDILYTLYETRESREIVEDFATGNVIDKGFRKETLLQHSVFCMVWNLFLMRCGTPQQQLAYGLMGLLHDIGKKTSKVVTKNGTAVFPYHGEISSSVCYAFFSKKHAQIVPYNVWDHVCQAIRVHMCGYNSMGETEDQLMKWNYLRLEEHQTREFLVIQSIADVYARTGVTSIDFHTFFESRTKFEEHLNTPFDIDFARHAVNELSPSNTMHPKSILIMVRSINVQEKDAVISELLGTLKKNNVKHILISKDNVIEDFVKDHFPIEYEQTINHSPTANIVSKLYAIYSPNIQTRVNNTRIVAKEIRERIRRAISNDCVIILDDSSMMFTGASDLFPQEVAGCLKIAIDVRSTMASRYSLKYGDLQKQLNSMNTQDWELLPPRGNSLFNSMRSCMSAKTFKSGLMQINTAHLVFPVVSNQDYSNQGLDKVFRALRSFEVI